MLSKYESNTNFGWNIKTHKKITKYAIKHSGLNLRERDAERLVDASKQPDIDEMNYFGSDHFCFVIPDDMKPKTSLSFLDFSGKHNALAKFRKHIEKAQKALEKKKPRKSLEEIGRAAHFLQDMCVPLHTEKGTLITKFRDLDTHLRYEDGFVGPQIDSFLRPQNFQNPTPGEAFERFALSLFKSNFHISSNLRIHKGNEDAWGQIAQETMDKAVSSTQQFLCAFMELPHAKIFNKK